MFRKKLHNDSSGMIALLFRRIIKNNNLMMVLENLVDKYIEKTFSSTYERTTEKTNYMTTIRSGRMTVKKFIEIFIDLFEIRHMSFVIETVYNDVVYTAEHTLDLETDHSDVCYHLLQNLLDNGLKDYLKESIDKNVNKLSKSDKAKYIVVSKIKNTKLTWKTIVEILSDVFRVEYIKLTCKIEYGKRSVLEESSSIRVG